MIDASAIHCAQSGSGCYKSGVGIWAWCHSFIIKKNYEMVKHTEDSIKYLYISNYEVEIPEITTQVKVEAPGPHSKIRGLCIILSFTHA